MTFHAALKRLGIEDYEDRIVFSNSHGELMHLADYFEMAKNIKGDAARFRWLFELCVEFAEQEWSRPESCFQHMPRLMREMDAAIIDEKLTASKRRLNPKDRHARKSHAKTQEQE